MIKVVFDTVILVRSQLGPTSRWAELVFDRVGQYQLLVSPSIVDEYLDVLGRPKLARKYTSLPGRNLARVLRLIENATIVVPDFVPAICRDPGDDMILAAALAGEVDFIVSEDKDLLDLGAYEGIQIVDARTVLTLLDDAAAP